MTRKKTITEIMEQNKIKRPLKKINAYIDSDEWIKNLLIGKQVKEEN